jgi:cytochrome c oxidase subunit II
MINHSALDPAGPQAAHIAGLWWIMFWTTGVVFVLVMAVLAWAILGRRRFPTADADRRQRETRLARVVAASVAVSVIILVILLVSSIWTGVLVNSLQASSAVSIDVVGHQWWWEIQYEDAVPNRQVTTANEIHIPVGRPIAIKVTSRDVIHSFWVPNLDGKRDLIPGYTTALWIQADQPAVYHGQCAEFCGRQHAHMAFDVVAEPEDAFDAWLAHQRTAPPPPATDDARQGENVFMSRQCVACHTIRGTAANGLNGPDLTHVASRMAIGAGTLPNTPGHLSDWITNPQAAKPGNLMPPNVLAQQDVRSLIAYLETLQ